jgi:hypothetical protein
MSFDDGWAALHLDMPARVPRTEYSAEMHWDLLRTVTGVPVSVDSPEDTKCKARQAFFRAWNYDLFWSTLIGGAEFGDHKTDMGHAVYAAGGTDYRPVGACPFSEPEDVLGFDFSATFGTPDHAQTVRRFEQHYRAGCAGNPDGVNMTGVYITLVSGFIDLFGWDMLLLAAGTDPERFGTLADRYAQWMQHYFDALAAANVPVVMIHDDIVWTSGPFIHPDWYRQHVFPHYARYFAPLRESGKIILFTSDGNYTAFIDDIAACGISGFVMEPVTDMACIAEKYGRTHAFIGNADTRVLLKGDRSAIRAEVERCMRIGKACPGFFMAVGNHIPPNTPVESALYYNAVYEKLSRR